MASQSDNLNIIGCGRLGKTLGHLLHHSGGLDIAGICNRSLPSATEACEFIGTGTGVASPGDCPRASIWLLAVPDDSIAAVAKQLAASRRDWRNTLVFHCSGIHDSGLLSPVADCGAHTASMHPAHSFANPAQSVRNFAGTICAMEGDDRATERLSALMTAIGGEPLIIDRDAKPLYHAATTVASNYLVTLQYAALQMLSKAGIGNDDGLRLLGPLLKQTVANILASGVESALTGPISRGDSGTVAHHLQALSTKAPELEPLYRQLGRLTAKLAQSGATDREKLDEVAALLNKAPTHRS